MCVTAGAGGLAGGQVQSSPLVGLTSTVSLNHPLPGYHAVFCLACSPRSIRCAKSRIASLSW